jgi:hypothetical protein
LIASSINVRFGSKADICGAQGHVCFTSKSGHVRCNYGCPLWANSGHLPDVFLLATFALFRIAAN